MRHGGPPSPVFHVPGGAASQAVDVRQRRTLLALRSGGPGAWHGQGGWWLQEGARDLNGDQTSYYLSIQPSTHPSIYLSIYLSECMGFQPTKMLFGCIWNWDRPRIHCDVMRKFDTTWDFRVPNFQQQLQLVHPRAPQFTTISVKKNAILGYTMTGWWFGTWLLWLSISYMG